jgi:hypothetical protein
MTDNLPARRDGTLDSWVDMLGPVGQLATQIARTQFVPKAMQGQPASVAASILTGREMGLGPMTALRGIDVIEGRPSLTSEMLAARIFAAGHRIEWRHVADDKVTVRIERGDGLSEAETTWTMHDARRAGLANKQNWVRYPRAMLRARALSECAQLACPDVALGLDVVASVDTAHTPQSGGAGATTVVQVGPAPAPEPPLGILEVAETDADSARPPGVSEVKVGRVAEETRSEVERDSDPVTHNTSVTEPLITGPQMRKLGVLIGQWEALEGTKLDREQRRTLIRNMAGLDTLASAKDLTAAQASAAIEALDMAIQVRPVPTEEPG